MKTNSKEESKLNQKMVNDFYTICLRKRFHTENAEALRVWAEAKGIRMRILDGREQQFIHVSDRKGKVLGQLPIRYFLKK